MSHADKIIELSKGYTHDTLEVADGCVFNLNFKVPGYGRQGLNLAVASANHFNMVIATDGHTIPRWVLDALR